jgi:hypothetical protein
MRTYRSEKEEEEKEEEEKEEAPTKCTVWMEAIGVHPEAGRKLDPPATVQPATHHPPADVTSRAFYRNLPTATLEFTYTANPRITRLIRSEKSSRNTKTRKVNN